MDDTCGPQARTDPPAQEGTSELPIDHFFQVVLMHQESLQAWTAWKEARQEAGTEAGLWQALAAERAALLKERMKGTTPAFDPHNEGDADR